MNLDALNWLIKSIISNFKCSSCNSWNVTNKDINIKNIEWKSVLLDIVCSNCWKSSYIKSEVVSLDLNKLNIPADKLEKLKNTINKNNSSKINKSKKMNNEEKISDNIIVELNKDLKKEKFSVEDLFFKEEK